MLVLNIKADRTLLIGDDIKIKVLKAKGGWAKIAIDAPREMAIDRAEIREAKDAERAEAEKQQRA